MLNFGTINCSITLCSNHGGVLCKPAKAGLAPRVILVQICEQPETPTASVQIEMRRTATDTQAILYGVIQ